MLATAVAALPVGKDWAFEFKWDGVRTLMDVTDSGVRLTSRAGNDVTTSYPELLAQAADVGDALLDGEIVAIAQGRPSFELLQTRMHIRSDAEARTLAQHTPVTFVVFDVLRRYGLDLTARPYSERRATLERWAAEHDGWTLSPAFDDGPATQAAARQHGLEGVVAKRLSSRYRPGVRSADWVKLRFTRSGDFAVIGWESAADRPGDLSSVLLAQYAGGVLTYAGKAGSGLTALAAQQLTGLVVAAAECPLAEPVPSTRGRIVHWVEPTVVVEVEFTERTDDGRLRHPVFRGVRPDKHVEEASGDG
ncbi:MAG TPA: non-homologous end-joining DNA ligase [Jatrophihabitantaceae bacterium]|jgi:bifunctional non-homologous end joining protein LigD|nr:non-homologous end-joining DNA ligase [Jatrophihabitantaceae bacterium]